MTAGFQRTIHKETGHWGSKHRIYLKTEKVVVGLLNVHFSDVFLHPKFELFSCSFCSQPPDEPKLV